LAAVNARHIVAQPGHFSLPRNDALALCFSYNELRIDSTAPSRIFSEIENAGNFIEKETLGSFCKKRLFWDAN
jgi:hypothetical protein